MARLLFLIAFFVQALIVVSWQHAPNGFHHEHALAHVEKRAPAKTHTTATSSPSGVYVVVSPTSCPAAQPTGNVVGQNSAKFAKKNSGLQYQQYSDTQIVIQDHSNTPTYVDLSNPDAVSISTNNNETLIVRSDGTFDTFLGNNACEVQVGGIWQDNASISKMRLAKRQSQSSNWCNGLRAMCNSQVAQTVLQSTPSVDATCTMIGSRVGAALGAGVGFEGIVGGPLVVVTELGGAAEGAELGGALGKILCRGGLGLIKKKLCTEAVCSDAIYRDSTDRCDHGSGPGTAVWCCSGDCANDCTSKGNLCLDLQGGAPSCAPSQVLYPGTGVPVDSGDGKCYINASDCRWQRGHWRWACCDCPSGSKVIQNSSQCNVGDPTGGAQWPPWLPCVGCDPGRTLSGDDTSGYYCNW